MLIGPKCSFFLDIWDIKRSLSRCSGWSSEMKTDLEICPNYYFLFNASPISGETRVIRKPAWNVIGVKMRFRGCKETGLGFNPRLLLCCRGHTNSFPESDTHMKRAGQKYLYQIEHTNWSQLLCDKAMPTVTKKLFLRLCVQNNVISSLWSKFCLKVDRSKSAS